MSGREKDKNRLLIILVVIIFIIILITWRIFLKFIQPRAEQKENSIFPELFNQGSEIKTELGQKIYPLINSYSLESNSDDDNIPSEEVAPALTNEEAKKIEGKILEYLNKKKSD